MSIKIYFTVILLTRSIKIWMGLKQNLPDICITVDRIVIEMDHRILLVSQNLRGNLLRRDGLYNTRRSHVVYTPVSTLQAFYGCLKQSCKTQQNLGYITRVAS